MPHPHAASCDFRKELIVAETPRSTGGVDGGNLPIWGGERVASGACSGEAEFGSAVAKSSRAAVDMDPGEVLIDQPGEPGEPLGGIPEP